LVRQVKLYTTPTCPYCKMAKKFLDDHGIKYEEFNIVEDKAARDEMKNKCKSLAVPTICFNDEVIIGFNEVELRKKLGL
jgi:glutaredoxin 3